MSTSLPSSSFAIKSPPASQAASLASDRVSARAGRLTPNQATYVRASHQKHSALTAASATWAPATPARPSPPYTAAAVNAPPTRFSPACSSMRLYPRFMPCRAASGTESRPPSTPPASTRAAAIRIVVRSPGQAPVIAGAYHTTTAATAAASGRQINQTTSAPPRARRWAAESATDCRLATSSRSASDGRPPTVAT